jgi:hypothetical protein
VDRRHKPNPKLVPDRPDKGLAMSIERAGRNACLAASVDEARELMRMAAGELFDAGRRLARPPGAPELQTRGSRIEERRNWRDAMNTLRKGFAR